MYSSVIMSQRPQHIPIARPYNRTNESIRFPRPIPPAKLVYTHHGPASPFAFRVIPHAHDRSINIATTSLDRPNADIRFYNHGTASLFSLYTPSLEMGNGERACSALSQLRCRQISFRNI